MNRKTLFPIVIPFVTILLIAGCGGSDSGSGTGTINLGITDAPVDSASSVVVEFNGVELKPNGGSAFSIDFNSPKSIDLLNLQGSDFEFLLDEETVNAGDYNWLRLKVNAEQNVVDSYIKLTIGGGKHSLYVPSGDQSGLKLNNGFTVPEDGVLNLTVDFDLRRSIVEPQAPATDYKLKPTLRLVQNADAGHIVGTVPNTLASAAGCSGAVYLFQGADITADDFDGVDAEPLSSSLVNLNTDSGEYEYGIGFLDAGDYTVSFTCDAADDIAEQDDALNFVGTGNVTVTAGETTEHNITQ